MLFGASIYFIYFSKDKANIRLDTGLREPIEYMTKILKRDNSQFDLDKEKEADKIKSSIKTYRKKLLAKCPIADGFDFPIGKPDAENYYNAQGFLAKNNQFITPYHLGEDWNGVGGGNSDLGDPVYSCADGVVYYAIDLGNNSGWGGIVRIIHKYQENDEEKFIESFYGHLTNISVKEGEIVKRGQQIGKIGNVGGRYWAHLHLEIRTKLWMPVGGGYAPDKNKVSEYVHPTNFINKHRPTN